MLTAGVNNAAKIGLTGITLETVQAILSEEIIHIQVLAAAFGAKPLTDSFTIPDPKILSDFMTFFETLEVADTIFNAAYMTATREFAELGQPTLAKITYQTGSVEAEHRVLARATLAQAGNNSYRPVTNKAYETDLFLIRTRRCQGPHGSRIPRWIRYRSLVPRPGRRYCRRGPGLREDHSADSEQRHQQHQYRRWRQPGCRTRLTCSAIKKVDRQKPVDLFYCRKFEPYGRVATREPDTICVTEWYIDRARDMGAVVAPSTTIRFSVSNVSST